MIKNLKLKIKNSEEGISLVITFFITVIIIGIVLVVSTILYSQIKVIRNIGESVISFYAADSGIEKILFYDRQAMPDNAKRGMCSMFTKTTNSDGTSPDYCAQDPTPTDASDHSVYCNAVSPDTIPYKQVIDPTAPDGCDPLVCNNCEVKFSTIMSSGKTYIVDAKIFPGSDGTSTDFTINSNGSYKNVSRAINIFITKAVPQQVITVISAAATPRSVPNGIAVDIQTEVKSSNGISRVYAYIKNSSEVGITSNIVETVPLSCSNADIKDRFCCAEDASQVGTSDIERSLGFTCATSPVLSQGTYYVDLDIFDMHEIESVYTDISPYLQQ